MSFDISLQSPLVDVPEQDRAFAEDAVSRILAPYVDADWYSITTADGEADLYCEDPGHGFTVNHATGLAIWDLLVEVAKATEFAILPVGCGTCIPYEGMRESVPDDFPQPVVVVQTGADLLAAINRS